MKHRKLVMAISKCIAIGVIGIQAAQAGNSITVDSISDQPEPGLTTLREAIEQSNNISGAEINFDTEVFSEPQTLTLQNGELLISSSMTIIGPGKDTLTIDGQDLSRIFTIDDGTSSIQTVEVSGITFTNGNGTSAINNNSGGCIMSLEDLIINESVVTTCSSRSGGGIFSFDGALVVNNSTISNNTANNRGGGFYQRGSADTVISNSTITGNSANYGGGVYLTRGAGAEFTNTTISNNQANQEGAGIKLDGGSPRTVIKNSTIINNIGTGIDLRNTEMHNTIIAGNSGGDCLFLITGSDNQNNLDTDGSCDVEAINHITVIDPMMGALADNGGFALTHLPLSGSPVIDSGDNTLCLEFDQRGRIRPQDSDEDGSAVCDIGAVELTAFEDIIFINGFNN